MFSKCVLLCVIDILLFDLRFFSLFLYLVLRVLIIVAIEFHIFSMLLLSFNE